MESKKIVKGTQIFKLKGLAKLSYQRVQELRIVASDDNVIYIDQEINYKLAMMKNEEGGISKRGLKPHVQQLG